MTVLEQIIETLGYHGYHEMKRRKNTEKDGYSDVWSLQEMNEGIISLEAFNRYVYVCGLVCAESRISLHPLVISVPRSA